MYRVLKDPRAGHRPISTWFLEITFVWNIGMCTCTCVSAYMHVCVCVCHVLCACVNVNLSKIVSYVNCKV